MRPGFINSFRPSFRTPLGGGLELLGFVERSRPTPVVAFYEGRVGEFMASEPVWQGDLAQTGDHMRGAIVPIFPPGSALGLMRHANGGVRLGVDDGINYWMRWNNGPAVPTLNSSFAAASSTAINQYSDNCSNVNFSGTGGALGGVTINGLLFDIATDSQTYLFVVADASSGSGVWSRPLFTSSPSSPSFLLVQDTRQRRCVSIAAPMSRRQGNRARGFVGGSEGGVAFVEVFERLSVGVGWSFVNRVSVAGAQVDQILVLLDDTGSGSGRLLLSQPDGLRSYTFATPGGALTLEWFVPGSDGFGIEQNIDGTLIWGKGAELVALTRQGVVEQILPLPGTAPRAGKIAVSPWGVGAQGRVFVGGVSGNGLGTTGYLYNLLTSPRSRFLPINNSLYMTLAQPIGLYQNISPNQYDTPNFWDGQEGDTYRLDNCLPGVRLAETNTRIYNSSASGADILNPWVSRAGSASAMSFVLLYTPEQAPLSAASVGALGCVFSIGSGTGGVRRGVLTTGDNEDRVRLQLGTGAGMPNGEGQWSFPVQQGVEYNIVVAIDQNRNYISWFIDGVLAGETFSWTAFNGVDWSQSTNLGRNGSGAFSQSGSADVGGRLRGPFVGWPRCLSPREVQAVYDEFRDVWPTPETPLATGGDVVYDITVGGQDYRVHIFFNNGNFVVTEPGTVEMLLVGGGGGGGWAPSTNTNGAGGGGGGGVVTNLGRRPFPVAPSNYAVVVGAGGQGGVADQPNTAQNGQNTTFAGIEAVGGGRGGSGAAFTAGDLGIGGCGGGAAATSAVPLLQRSGVQGRGGGNYTQGFGAQGAGGGGGGQERGSDGTSSGGGAGGLGLLSDITGTPTRYAGGGGGGINGTLAGVGGAGGGGGGLGGTPGQDGFGGGGAGASRFINGRNGGDGGSGIVIVRYPLP